jgi:molybdate transport system substrate-binding protein
MKKIIAILLVLTLVLGASACASGKTADAESAGSSGSAAASSAPAAASAAASSAAASSASSATAASSSAAASSSVAASAEPVSLTVFAAASMTETLTELGDKYMKENPNVKITFTFDSSGTLKSQIQEGADCDLFISAAQKQMDQLDATCDTEKNPDKLDFIDHDTRVDILENKVALVVPDANPKNINSFDDLKSALQKGGILMAMGNSDVPVGQYTQKLLTYLGLDEKKLADAGLISYGSNVKEVTSQVSEAAADCGIIYATDAYSAKLKVVATATKEMCGQVIYPAAVLKASKNADAAKAFLDYIQTPDSMAVFEAVGFSALK